MPENAKDLVIAALGSSVGLAGLLLVFIGFIYSRGESMQNTARGSKVKLVARLGVVPFVLSLLCAWFSIAWLAGCGWAYWWSFTLFQVDLLVVAVYGVVALLFFM